MGRFIDITGAPIVSDFQEMPLDFMAKALSAKQASYDKQDLEAAALPGLFGEGFIATKGYKDILTKELNPKLAEWSKRAIADPEGVGRDIAKYKSQLATDARYRLLTADTAKKAEYLKDLKETNKLGKAYEKAFDYTTGQYKGPIDPDKLLKGEVVGDLEDFYGNPIYGDVHKDYTENLKNIKEISIEDVSTLFPGLNQYGDQLKTTKTFKVDSNSIYDPTVIGKDENGNPITIGEATKRKVHQVSDAILANNSVAAQYANTPLSPFRILEGALPKDASIIDKGRAYGEYVFSPMSKQSRTNKNEIVSFGTNAFDAAAKQPKTPEVLPLKTNFENSPYTFDDFQKSAQASAKTRNESWVTAKQAVLSLSPTLLTNAKISKPASGAVTEDDLDRLIKYSQKVNPNTLTTEDRTNLDIAKNNAIQYFANKRTLDFYTNQSLSVLPKVLDAALKDVDTNWQTKNSSTDVKNILKEGIKRDYKNIEQKIKSGDLDLRSITQIAPAFAKAIEKSGSLNISNAYISLNPKGAGYSETATDLADNIWSLAAGKKGAFEGQSPTADASEGLADLFKKQTGTEPKGKLTPKGAGVDENGRVGVVVEDSETGNTAIFVKNVGLEYTPYIKKYYKEIANSDDYIAKPVAFTGYLDTYLTEVGQKSSFDNFLSANYNANYNLGGININKSGNTFTYKDATGTHQFATPSALKADLGETIILSGN